MMNQVMFISYQTDMSFDNMRNSHARCPPLLVGGLLVVCFVLTFNWWSLTSQNYDLIKQLEDLGEQLKISSEEQDMCVNQRVSAENRVKFLEDEVAQLKVNQDQIHVQKEDLRKQMTDKDDEIRELNRQLDDSKKTGDNCITELESLKKLDISKDSTIASLRLEKDQFTHQLEEKKEEIQKLKTDIETMQGELAKAKGASFTPQVVKITQPSVSAKSAVTNPKRQGDLKPLLPRSVEIRPVGLQGMIYHHEPILPQDPPDAVRPKPRLSVTYLDRGPSNVPPEGVAEGADHEKVQEADKAENENNAAEKVDDANPDEEGAQIEEVVRMVVPQEELGEDGGGKKKDAVDQDNAV